MSKIVFRASWLMDVAGGERIITGIQGHDLGALFYAKRFVLKVCPTSKLRIT